MTDYPSTEAAARALYSKPAAPMPAAGPGSGTNGVAHRMYANPVLKAPARAAAPYAMPAAAPTPAAEPEGGTTPAASRLYANPVHEARAKAAEHASVADAKVAATAEPTVPVNGVHGSADDGADEDAAPPETTSTVEQPNAEIDSQVDPEMLASFWQHVEE